MLPDLELWPGQKEHAAGNAEATPTRLIIIIDINDHTKRAKFKYVVGFQLILYQSNTWL